MENTHNYGFDFAKEKKDQRTTDWIFGVGKLSGFAENIELINYLPIGEVQRGKEDMMDCTTRGPINIVEAKLNYWLATKQIDYDNERWLNENGYIKNGRIEIADAFTAIKSGTTRRGNSLIKPLNSLYKDGFVPKKLLPLENWMTWEDYHNPARITKQISDLALESKKRFQVNYERVYESTFPMILKYDAIDVAGYAWPDPVNGIYPRVSYSANHAFANLPKTPQYTIFDNYADPVDGDFIKRLAFNYDFLNYGYRIVVNELFTADSRVKEAVESIRRVFGPRWSPAGIFYEKHLVERGIFGAVRIMDSKIYPAYRVYTLGFGGSSVNSPEEYFNLFGTLSQIGICGTITEAQAGLLGFKLDSTPIKLNATIWDNILQLVRTIF